MQTGQKTKRAFVLSFGFILLLWVWGVPQAWAGELYKAAKRGDLNNVITLLGTGAKVNEKERDNNNMTALHVAAMKGNVDIVRLLLKHGADLNAKDSHPERGWTPLHYAVYSGRPDVVALLCDSGSKIDAKGANGGTPLHVAAAGYLDRVCKVLMEHGANVYALDAYGNTPVNVAGSRTLLEFKKWVSGDNVRYTPQNYKTRGGYKTPASQQSAPMAAPQQEIFDAVASGVSSRVTALLDADASLANATNPMGETPLHYAAAIGFAQAAEYLHKKGADVNRQSDTGNTPLHVAVWKDQASMVDLLLDFGANPNISNKPMNPKGKQGTPLHLAIARGNTEIARMLINRGAYIHARDALGMTPLASAAYWGRADIFGLLLSKKADINAKDLKGRTVVQIAKENGNWDAISRPLQGTQTKR